MKEVSRGSKTPHGHQKEPAAEPLPSEGAGAEPLPSKGAGAEPLSSEGAGTEPLLNPLLGLCLAPNDISSYTRVAKGVG